MCVCTCMKRGLYKYGVIIIIIITCIIIIIHKIYGLVVNLFRRKIFFSFLLILSPYKVIKNIFDFYTIKTNNL